LPPLPPSTSCGYVAEVITKRIVCALPPKQHRRPKAKAADMPKMPVIVEARDPRRIRRTPKLAAPIVDHSAPDMAENDQHQRGDAADALFAEIKRRVAGK
jgi:hypothetical protein